MTIGEASEKTGLSADTLRYYEKIGLIPPVPRRENGLRDYGAETIKLVALIQRLKETGMQLETIQAYLRLAMLGSSTREERRVHARRAPRAPPRNARKYNEEDRRPARLPAPRRRPARALREHRDARDGARRERLGCAGDAHRRGGVAQNHARKSGTSHSPTSG